MNKPGRGSLLAVLTVVALVAVGQAAAPKKPAKGTTRISGTVASIKATGSRSTLVVQVDPKTTREFQLTSRTPLTVTAPADVSFIARGQVLSTTAILSNNRFFAKQIDLYSGRRGRKPSPKLAKAAAKVGRSRNAWDICGRVISKQKDPKASDFMTVTIRAGQRTVSIYLDKGYKLTAVVSDTSVIAPGDKVAVDGRTRGKRFTVTAVTVTRSKPLPAPEPRKKPKPRSRKKKPASS